MPTGFKEPPSVTEGGLEAVVFDAYGTLFDVDSVAAECEKAYPGHGAALSNLWRRKQLEYTWLRALMGRYRDFESVTRDALRAAVRVLNLGITRETEEKLMDAYHTLRPFPDVKETLMRLRSSVRLAVLSNGTGRMLDKLIAHSGLSSLFEAVISVEKARTYKPDPRVYGLVMSDMGISAKSRVLYVSASSWDVAGSKSFGFRAAWINRLNAGFGEWHEYAPDYEIKRLTELVDLVRTR